MTNLELVEDFIENDREHEVVPFLRKLMEYLPTLLECAEDAYYEACTDAERCMSMQAEQRQDFNDRADLLLKIVNELGGSLHEDGKG